jgi:cell division transport system permease protein
MRFQFVLAEVAQGLRRNLSMVVSIVLVTFVSLTFVGAAALLQRQVSILQADWRGLVEVSVFLCPDGSPEPTCATGAATPERTQEIRHLIETELGHEVAAIHYESQDDAFHALESPVFQGVTLTAQDMSASLRLQLNNPENFDVVSDVLVGRDGIEEVVDQRDIFQPLFAVLGGASWIAAGLAAIMLATAALLITTTIRLSAVSRRKETSIMRLVGASNSFIQAPFLLEGAIAALVGSVLAVGGLLLAVRFLVTDWLAQSIAWVRYVGTADVLAVAPLLVGIAVLLAVSSSFISLHRYTRV